MKKSVLVVFLLAAIPLFGQNKVKKFTWHNEELQSFARLSPTVRSIAFNKNNSENLEIRPDSALVPKKEITYDGWYSTVYLGHIYRLTKKFGKRFPSEVLLAKLDSLQRRDCDANYFEGVVYGDRIEIRLTSYCPGDNGDHIFQRINDEAGFFGGTAAFQQLVGSRLSFTNYQSLIKGDSVLWFMVVIKKDSIAHEIRSVDSFSSPLRELVIKALTNTKGWKPVRKDGKLMNGWKEIFIRFRKDGTIEADFLHY